MSDNPLPFSTPETQGISSRAILDFVNTAEAEIDALHSFILVRHGHRVAQGWWAPYAPELPHMLFSLSKSFTSTAVGLAVADGLLSVDDPVIRFFPDDLPDEIGDNLAAMKVRHLLSMSTGHEEEPTGKMESAEDGNWAKPFLAQPVVHEPGTHFLYNTGASYMLSAIVQSLTGQTILDYLTPRILEPLGIEGAVWDTCPRGINIGGFGLWIRTEDIARFGQLYLQKGMWQGEQLLPAAWVEEATLSQIDNAPNDNVEWEQGYGYQFWMCRHNAYRGDGAFGQYCIVMPDQDAVLAITSGVSDMQAVFNLVWDKLLSAMKPTALSKDEAARVMLVDKLADLAMPPLQGQVLPEETVQAQIAGKTFAFDLDAQRVDDERHMPPPEAQLLKSIAFGFDAEGGTIAITDGRGPQPVAFGFGAWRKGTTMLGDDAPRRVAASGAWLDDRTLAVKLCFYETPFRPTITCAFDGDELQYQFTSNVGFGLRERPVLVAKAV
ncbi:MAG: serine hydrolase [Anaerolineae bacterium]|nr:serine hydrolase [Anaerolineae bacterium]